MFAGCTSIFSLLILFYLEREYEALEKRGTPGWTRVFFRVSTPYRISLKRYCFPEQLSRRCAWRFVSHVQGEIIISSEDNCF